MRVLVETPAGELLGEFVTESYVPSPGDLIAVREGAERRFRVKERGVRLATSPSATFAFVVVEAAE